MKKISQRQKIMQNYPVGEELRLFNKGFLEKNSDIMTTKLL